MEFWNKIDLHQHTLNEITVDGRSPKSLYTHNKFQEVIREEKVKLKAVTNHNSLNIIDHVKHALICNKNKVQYLPGVEIDYCFKSKIFQAISILNPLNDVIHFSNLLNEKVKSKGNNITFNKDDFADLHVNIEYIFIPHVMKIKGVYPSKDEPIVKEAEDWVMEVIQNGDFVPVIFENTKDYNKYTIYGKIEELLDNVEITNVACYVGSDYKFDNDIKRRRTAIERVKYYIFSEPSYRGLEIAVRNHETRLVHEDDKIIRNNYLESITISSNVDFIPNQRISLSPSLNVIIGGSGTGKTLLLNEIYRTITNDNLKDVTNGKNNNNKSAYFSKVGKEGILKINTFKNVSLDALKVVEIPNIYTEIMKYVNDYDKLGEVFNISNRSYIDNIINVFICNCDKYNELKENILEYIKLGEENLRIIHSGIDFFMTNKVEKSKYNLNVKVLENSAVEKLNKIMQKNLSFINKKDEIIKYFNDIDQILDSEYHTVILRILEDYNFLLDKLNERNNGIAKEQISNKINELIEKIINDSIRQISQKLGQREKVFKEREELFKRNQNDLINNVKKVLMDNCKINKLVIKYPYEEVKQTIEYKNSNELARFTLAFNDDYIKSITAEDDLFINSTNNLTKIRRAINPSLNLLNDVSIKNFLDNLRKEGLNVKDILKNTPSLNLELRVDSGEWKLATSVNQGTIAKVSMQYYFKSIVKKERPDIIFIDQPENDVDKDFLTKTLAKFLKDQKAESQIFITSHDPILTVNADANMIIQADVSSENKISYISYPLEFCEQNRLGTDDVAKILDGGKGNIEKRYQIYGGILKYEN